MRVLRRTLLLLLTLLLVAVALPPAWVQVLSWGRVEPLEGSQSAPVAIVFGAGLSADGGPSRWLGRRLDIAVELYRSDRVEAILVSGDGVGPYHDEPGAMRRYLEAAGVPSARIVEDTAGLDTYDSCRRAVDVFGVTEAILVSQTFHVDRALAICRSVGISAHAIGDDTSGSWPEATVSAEERERFAVYKAFWEAVVSERPPLVVDPPSPALTEAISG